MATRPVTPLLVGVVALVALVAPTGCRRPETQALVTGPHAPALRTRVLDTRPFESAPPQPAGDVAKVGDAAGEGRREGGVPESLVVGDDCSVRAVWRVTHLCGLAAKGTATWIPDKGMAFTLVKLEGAARTDCPPQVTRFETTIVDLADGDYRFGTARKAVGFSIRCADRR